MVGSEGTLGIITELTLKLIAPPKAHTTLIVPFAELADGIGAVPAIKRSALNPQTLEFFEKEILESSEAYLANPFSPRKWKARQWVLTCWLPWTPPATTSWTNWWNRELK